MDDRATSMKADRASGRAAIVAELGDWSSGSRPLFRQLARSLAAAIERGAIAPGTRLPSERPLATSMSVSRGTAVAAYQILVAEGLIERRHGSGTFVIGAGSLGLPPQREGSSLVARLVDRSAGPSEVVDLSISVLRETQGMPQVSVATPDLAAVQPDTGCSPWGLAGLRSALADLVAGWGLPTEPSQIVVTTGAQQALSVTAACWVRPGDAVVVEDPTYPGAVSAFAAAGARLVGLPVDPRGIDPDHLAQTITREHPALVYLQPTVHSPTGLVLSAPRRRVVARLVEQTRVPLVEDHALAGLRWTATPPPIATHAPAAPIAVLGSLSKHFWGGIRIGFVRAPEPVALRMARVKATHDLGSSAPGQLLAQRLLEHPDRASLLAQRNRDLRARYDHLAGLLSTHLPSWTWTEPAGGLSVWVRLPQPVAEPFSQAALRAGCTVATGDPLSPTGHDPHHIRLSFSASRSELTRGVDLLAGAWSAFDGGRRRPCPAGAS